MAKTTYQIHGGDLKLDNLKAFNLYQSIHDQKKKTCINWKRDLTLRGLYKLLYIYFVVANL